MWFVKILKTWWIELSGLISGFLDWSKEHWKLLLIVSVSSFVLSIIVCTVLITYLPSNYFKDNYQRKRVKNPILRFFVSFFKNIVGFIIIILGALMSVPGVPGQGLLTILVGLIISDFPGKNRLLNRIIHIRTVSLAANKIRLHFNRPPLEFEE